MSRREEEWRRADPFEKAREWAKVDLQIARSIVDQGLKRAERETQLLVNESRHKIMLATETSAHLRKMDLRRWRLQLVATVGALTCILGLIAVAWLYAESGNYVPAAAIFTLGSALTGCVYGVQRSNSKDAKRLLQELESLAKRRALPAEAGAAGQ
jgi:hypothetical protein